MSQDAVPQLAALTQRAQTLATTGAAADAAAVDELLTAVMAIAADATLAPTRALGAGLNEAASALIGLAPPQAVEAVFGHAQRILRAAVDTLFDDWLVLWNNLAALYDRYGANEHLNRTLSELVRAAQFYDGPLRAYGANVCVHQATLLQRNGQTEAMLPLLRLAHRWFGSDEFAPEDRSTWLKTYAEMLLEAGRRDDAEPLLAQGIALAHELDQAEREAELRNLAATTAFARGDATAALALIEPARQLIDRPALAQTSLAYAVLRNRVVCLLRLGDAERDADARRDNERAIGLVPQLGLHDSAGMAHLLHHRAVLLERAGDGRGAALAYRAAAEHPAASPAQRCNGHSLAGRAWFDAGDFDAASECYLEALRLRVAAPAPAPA